MSNNSNNVFAIERTESLKVQVAKQLRRQLQRAVYAPGQRLTEVGVAKLLQVSRTPAREALSLLGESGVLESLPNGGYAVPKLSHQDINNIYEVRGYLETPALKKVVKTAGGDIVDTLKEILNRLDSYKAGAPVIEFFESFVLFRDTLFKACGNVQLSGDICRLDSYAEYLKVVLFADADVRIGASQTYRDIVTAIENRDVKGAGKILKEHHKYGLAEYHKVLDQLNS